MWKHILHIHNLKVSAQKIMSKEGELGSPEQNWHSPLPCKIQRPANDCVKKVKATSHIAWSLAGTAIEDINVFIWMTPPLFFLKWRVYLWHRLCGRSMWCFRSRQQWWLEVFYTSPFFLPSLISRSSQLTVPLCFPFHFLRVSYDDTYGVGDIWALSVILCRLTHQEDSKLKPDNILLVN